MYPLKYIASSIMKYATANWSMWSNARRACCRTFGRKVRLAGTAEWVVVFAPFLTTAASEDEAVASEPAWASERVYWEIR